MTALARPRPLPADPQVVVRLSTTLIVPSSVAYTVSPDNTDLDGETADAIERLVTDWLADGRIPGASVAVVDGDGLVYGEGFGARDLETDDPATPETLFPIGSCTKSVTALAVLRLHDRGDLDLSDPAGEYVEFVSEAPGPPITIEELLTHTSGLPSDGNAVVSLLRAMGVHPFEIPLSDWKDFERHVRGAFEDRTDPADERFFYYNAGYTVLGRIVERVTGRQFEAYVRDEILAPLGMDRATFAREDYEADDDAATPYHDEAGQSTESGLLFKNFPSGAGGLLAPTTELANYVAMFLNGGAYRGKRIVPEALLDRMVAPKATRRRTIDGDEERYGYGVGISELAGETLVGHGGSVGSASAYFGYLPDSEWGVALAANTQPEPHPTAVGEGVLAACTGSDPVDAVPALALREKFAPLTGEYASYRDVRTATVERNGGTLELEMGSLDTDRVWTLVPERTDASDRRFYTVSGAGVREPAEFVVEDGSVDLFFQRWRLHKRT